MIKVVTFAGSLTHAGKNRVAAVTFGNVVNQLLNQHGFTHAGATEQTDFTTFGIRLKQVNNLNTGCQNLGFGRLLRKRRRFTVNREL